MKACHMGSCAHQFFCASPDVMLERGFMTIRAIGTPKLDPTYSSLGFLCIVEAGLHSAVNAGLKLTVILMPCFPKW